MVQAPLARIQADVPLCEGLRDFGGCRGRTRLPELIDRYMAGDIKVDEFVTETIRLEQINDAFERMKRDEGYRYIVDYRA